jgi:hypothetical protein
VAFNPARVDGSQSLWKDLQMLNSYNVNAMPDQFRTVIGNVEVSTAFVDGWKLDNSRGWRWENCTFTLDADGYRIDSTDPMISPDSKSGNALHTTIVAEIMHEIICYRVRAGQGIWDASHVTTDDIKRYLTVLKED